MDKSSEKGMTFLELLLVLTILGALTLIVVPVSHGWTTEQSERDAFEAFQATVQEMQAYSMAHQTTTWLSFSNNGSTYHVKYWDTGELKETHFPPTIRYDSMSNLKFVSFQENGNMFKTGALIFQTSDGEKKITFQFQRGRMLVYE
ncbi:prepilin-type N-terminal cleavage/methylation domain-containing protein [Sporosarcina sp. A2]|uniref:prepilin-type N-terminal cleavage/methylation domain-containing protein n=1 Tax=Sporosarcina sp. A2 TaxID=3393449 RepID=UPI003D7A0FF0